MIDLILASLSLWLLFIPAANLINRHRQKEYTGVRYYLSLSYIYFFVTMDVLFNYTYGAVLFLQLANNDRKTLTARLKHYLRTEPDSRRGKMAYIICAYMIEPWDFGHCAVSVR